MNDKTVLVKHFEWLSIPEKLYINTGHLPCNYKDQKQRETASLPSFSIFINFSLIGVTFSVAAISG